MPYKGTIEVISGLKQANNQDFALAKTHDIWAEEPDKRLDEVIEDIIGGDSGSLKTKADKADTVLDTYLSRGRKANTDIGGASFAFGTNVEATNLNSHAEGSNTHATATQAHAEGYKSTASGSNSHAEGNNTVASGAASHAEGAEFVDDRNPMQVKTYQNKATGDASHAEGQGNTVSGQAAHGEGIENSATGLASHVEGFTSRSAGEYSHAEGYSTTATGNNSHAEGSGTIAAGENQHVEGKNNVSSETMLHIVGNGTTTSNRSNAFAIDASGNGYFKGDAYVSCDAASANGNKLATEGYVNTADALKADKRDTVLTTTLSRGRNATPATGIGSFAFGEDLTAMGSYSHAEGSGTYAYGRYSHVEGHSSIAGSSDGSGQSAHAEGELSSAPANYAHAEGYSGYAAGIASHSEGYNTDATGNYSHSEGNNTIAAADSSHVVGTYNVSDSYDNWPEYTPGTLYEVGAKIKRTENQVVVGYICNTEHTATQTFNSSKWDARYKKMNYVEIVGNGTISARSNARALDWNGNEYLKGDIYVNCDTSSANGNKVATEGYVNTADALKADKTNTILETYLSRGRKDSTTIGTNSFAFGIRVEASGSYSHGEGKDTVASGSYSHAEGNSSKAIGGDSHAEGSSCRAEASSAHAEGSATAATGNAAHTEGSATSASAIAAHAEGATTTASAWAAHSEGKSTTASGKYSHAEGNTSIAEGESSHAEGFSTTATGNNSHAEGGKYIETIEGITTETSVLAYGESSHAEGQGSQAYGAGAHAEGRRADAREEASHAEGLETKANGKYSHAEGSSSTADGQASHAEGNNTKAKALYSHAEGTGTIANATAQHVEGKYNVSNDTMLHIIGNGSSNIVRSNAFAVDPSGNGYFDGDIYAECDASSANGKKVATENYVQTNFAPLASPALTGIPTAPTAAAGTNTTQIATTAFVMNAFSANDAMVFKGTIGTGGTVTALPATHQAGWTYKVITAGSYAGQTCEIGDMIICIKDGTAAANADWSVVQNNVDGAVVGPSSSTSNNIATFNSTTGKVIKDSGKKFISSLPVHAQISENDIPSAAAIEAYIVSWFEYQKIGVSSLSVSPALAEKGSTVTSATLTYSLNKAATAMKLDNTATTNDAGTMTASGTITKTVSITSDKTWTLWVEDTRPDGNHNNASKTCTTKFVNRVFYGAAAIPGTINSAFVRGLANSPLDEDGVVTGISITTGSGQYMWYASTVNNLKFNVGGFDGGFESPSTVQIKNAGNVDTTYYVYRSTNANLGAQTITVKK